MSYAVIDNEDIIWGTGDTEAAAMADARSWLEINHADGLGAEDYLCLRAHKCTPELVQKVAICGGQVAWRWSGTLERHMTLQ